MITFTDLNTPEINSGSAATSYASASWTPPANTLVIVAVASRIGVGTPNQPTITGNGLTWTAIKTVLDTSSTFRGTFFGAYTVGATTGATTVDFAGQSQQDCHASFLQADGTTVLQGVAYTFVQSPTNTTAASTTLSITLATASNTFNRPVSLFVCNGGLATPQTNWTEYYDAGSNCFMQSQYQPTAFETTASTTQGGTQRISGIAVEIRAAVGSFAPFF